MSAETRLSRTVALPASIMIFAFTVEIAFVILLYGPLFAPLSGIGIVDYDQFLAWKLAVFDALRSGRVLHWFHHLCGGVPGLADPQSQALSPMNLLGLAMDPVVQMKVSVAVHLFACAAGFHMLARRARIPAQFAVVAFVIWSGNGFVAFRLLHGQETFYPLLYLPLLVALLWPHLAQENNHASFRKDLFWGTALVSLMILEDGFQVLIHAWILLGLTGLANLLLRGDSRALRALLIWMAWAVALCSVRLLPMAELLIEYPRLTDEKDFLSAVMVRDAFLNPHQLDLYLRFLPEGPHNVWAAYGAYTGWVPLLLFGWGALRMRSFPSTALVPVAIGMLGCLLLMLGHFSDWSPWALLHRLPLMDMVRAPHRFAGMVILGIAVFALFTQADLHRRFGGGERKAFIIALVAAGACAAGQVRALRPLLEAGFAARQFPHAHIAHDAEFIHRITDPARMYSAVAANQGVHNCYRALELPNAARPDAPLAVIADADGTARGMISPNTITVQLTNDAPAAVLINENHHRDWTVVAGRSASMERTGDGLMLLRASPGTGAITLRFVPRMFIAGAVVSVICLLASWFMVFPWARARVRTVAALHPGGGAR